MRLLLIQLSDMHCINSDNYLFEKVDKAIRAIDTLGKVDAAVLIFSGDLTDTANPNEFKVGRKVIGKFLSQLSGVLECGFIPTKIVPGNHDIFLPKECRGANEIKKWNKQEHLEDELSYLKNFFEYSTSKNCFVKDKLCDVDTIVVGGLKLQICLLNSAPYSTRDPDDKQFHYLPGYVSEKLVRDPEADLKITVMHHHYEWCEWGTKELLKNALATDDIVFFGHDHKPESVIMHNGDGSTFNIIMGGRFNLKIDQDSTFNAVIFDKEKNVFELFKFNWIIGDRLFTAVSCGEIKKKRKAFSPKESYLAELLKDNQGIGNSFMDYYVFPKLAIGREAFTSEGNVEFNSVENIFAAIKSDKAIEIIGNSNAGKTTLLRYLYFRSIEFGFIPILIEKKDYKDNRIDRMLRGLFEDQYGVISKYGYDSYDQADRSKQIIFIDDIDLISSHKAQENLIRNVFDSGRLLIYTTKEKNINLEDIVKTKLQGVTINTIEIKPFYKETRDKLVQKVCKVCGKEQKEVDAIIGALDYMVQCQTSFFTFTPVNMLQYIKFFLYGGANNRKNVQTISMVFETNIRNAILSCEKDFVANVYLMVLEYIADQMYFVFKTEKISITDFETIIEEFKNLRRVEVNAKLFLNTCIEARIFKDDNRSFSVSFFDSNTYAYFVAKAINREFEKDQTNTNKLLFIMDRICFGINDTIILFLSFIRNNTNIILKIAEDATEMMANFPEWSLEAINIPFLHQFTKLSDKLPSAEEKRNVHKQTEKVEEECHDAIQFRSIFDYNEADVNKKRYVVLRALKYSQLIGRALVDQYGALNANEIDRLVKTLYSIPQKVIYAILKPQQDHISDIINSIITFVREKMPDEDVKDDHIKLLLGEVGTFIALGIMNDIAYNASNENTIIALRNYSPNNINYKIMLLMMEENVGITSEFVSKAIALRKELDDCYYAKTLISQIARKHVILTDNIDHRQVDRLVSGKVISTSGKATLLLKQGKKGRS